MQKLFGRMMLPLVLLVVALASSSQAFAADTWLPRFNPQQHVYVDPALTNPPVNVSGLEQQLVQAGRTHNLQIFFIMAERGTENIPNAQFGTQMLDKLIASWQGVNGFPSDDYLIITVFRLPGGDWQKTARGGNAGPRLRTIGFASPSTLQNILDAHKSRLSNNDVKGFVTEVVKGVNGTVTQFHADAERRRQQEIADAERARQQQIADAERARQQEIADREAAAQRAEQMEVYATWATYGGPPLAVVILLIVLFVIARKKRGIAEQLLSKGRTEANTLATNYDDLQDKGLGLLNGALGWETRLKNRSLKEVQAAMALYSQLTDAKLEISARLDTAEAAFSGQKNPFAWGGYNTVIRLYTVAEITVTGKQLTPEQRTLFGATVQTRTYKMPELMAEMETVYTTLKGKLKQLEGSFRKVRENKADIERLMGEVDALKPKLAENELVFDPYQAGYDELIQARDAFLGIMDSDPLEASDDSQAVEDGVTAVKAALNRAIALKQSLATTAKQIAQAVKKVADTRGKAADYSYPEVNFKAPEGVPANLLLAEQDGNPDKQIADAEGFLASALKLVVAGKLDESDKAKANCEAKTSEASTLVDTIVAAAAFIQKGVPGIRTTVGKLKTEITGGDASVDELNAGFLKKNFESQPGKLVTAKSVRDKTEGELAKIRAAFVEQRYLAGRALLEAIGSDIQGSRDAIVEVHTKLAELKAFRDHAKTTVASAADLATSLVRKLKSHEFTTSKATDSTFAGAQPVLARQQTDVALAVTDWPAAAKASDELLATLKGVDSNIDLEKRAFDNANTAISNLEGAIKSAAGECKHEYVRQATLTKLEEGRTALNQARRDVAVAKSDWNAIAARTVAGNDACTRAKALSASDKTKGTEAKAAIERAQEKIDGVSSARFKKSKQIGSSNKTFGENVRANTSTAAATLTSAESKFDSQDYEGAKTTANQAYDAAEAAETKAEQEVATAIAAAVLIQKQADDAAAERKRQDDAAEAARSRSTSSDFSSSNNSTSSTFDSTPSGSTSSNFD